VPNLLISPETGRLSESIPNTFREVEIASDPAEARGVQEEIEQALKANQFAERDLFSIKLALEEALINAIKHGNQMDRSKKVRIAFRVVPECFEVRIADEGPGFNPADVPDPIAVENLERPCGRGLLLMRHYMTEVVFEQPGNAVVMNKVCNASQRNGHAE
jgi:serine/threonine-protein kinase RsbW